MQPTNVNVNCTKWKYVCVCMSIRASIRINRLNWPSRLWSTVNVQHLRVDNHHHLLKHNKIERNKTKQKKVLVYNNIKLMCLCISKIFSPYIWRHFRAEQQRRESSYTYVFYILYFLLYAFTTNKFNLNKFLNKENKGDGKYTKINIICEISLANKGRHIIIWVHHMVKQSKTKNAKMRPMT